VEARVRLLLWRERALQVFAARVICGTTTTMVSHASIQEGNAQPLDPRRSMGEIPVP
jgi:hypothetical protein